MFYTFTAINELPLGKSLLREANVFCALKSEPDSHSVIGLYR